MLGFADIDDLDFLTRREIAARLGYSTVSSARRALKRVGAGLPPCAFRGRARGDVVKAWVALLPLFPHEMAEGVQSKKSDRRSPNGKRPDADRSFRSPDRSNVCSIEAARARMLARIRGAA